METREEIGRGEALFSSGKIEAAKDVFKKIVQNDPDNFEAVNNLGAVCYTLGDEKAAEAHFLRALEVEKDYFEALNNITILYQDANRWNDAALYLERLVSIKPKDSDALNRLATAYMKTGAMEKARKILSGSFGVEPVQEKLRENLSTVAKETAFPKAKIDKEPINILFVQDSPCIRNYKMATALRSIGHDVSLAYTVKRLSQRYSGLSDDTYNECIQLKNYRDLWDISGNYDLIHCHNEPDILTVAALAGNAPVIHDTHDLISLRANGDPTLSYFEGVANRGATGRVYSTHYQKAEAEELYGVNGPSLVFYNYTSESDLTNNFLPKLSGQDGRTHIVYEGGVGGSAHRDFTGLFIQLATYGIHLHIYPASYNENQAQFFSQYPCIHYCFPVSPKKIIEEMTRYDYGIIPFNLEKGNKRFLDSTIANKLFEYLAAGLPVIASPLKTYIDYFRQNPVGITFGSAKDIIDKLPILKAISTETDFSKQIYTFENEIFKLVDFYRQILGSPNRKAVAPAITKTRSEFVHDAFERLLAWIDDNGWAGYDPYDAEDFIIQKRKSNTPLNKSEENQIRGLNETDPFALREKLHIEKKINAKASGILMSSYVILYLIYEDNKYLNEAKALGEWLVNNRSKGYENYCWGYPFDWQSVIFIPKDTPSVVVSTVVGDGFWKLYELTRDEQYLKICQSICNYILNDLNVDKIDEKKLCFSYTTIDDYHVHNANLFAAEFLVRIGKEVDDDELIQTGIKAANYTISEQNKDGSIYYWGKCQDRYNSKHLDSYHSGFEIRMLSSVYNSTGELKFKQAYEKYINFYLTNYLLADGTVLQFPSKRNPSQVNIHGVAEAILLLSTLIPEKPNFLPLVEKIIRWSVRTLQHEDGWFGYMIRNWQRIMVPYLRWGEVWMMRGMSEYEKSRRILSREWGYYNQYSERPGRKAKPKESQKDISIAYKDKSSPDSIGDKEDGRTYFTEVYYDVDVDHPFMIIGVGRSGTTLLQAILNAHPDISIPPETHFVRDIIAKPEVSEIYEQGGLNGVHSYLNTNRYVARLGIDVSEALAPFFDSTLIFSFGNLFKRFLALYAKQNTKNRVGEKDPANIQYLLTIKDTFPNAWIIHIIRDPRDVVLSRINTKMQVSDNIAGWAKNYVSNFRKGRQEGWHLFGSRYLEIFYEDLVKNPENTIQLLCKKLNIKYDANMLHYQDEAKRIVSNDEMEWKKNVFKPIMNDNYCKWRKGLQPDQISVIETICNEIFSDTPYELSGLY